VRQLPDLSQLSDAEKDALIRALFQRLEVAERRIAELEAKLGDPPKTPDNSSLPPSNGQKPHQAEKARRNGPRQGSLGRKGGGRPLACDPDETVIAKAVAWLRCQAVLGETVQVLHGRYDAIDLPVVRPRITRMERHAGHCPCCGGVTLKPVPEGMKEGSPFSVNILALAIYLRFTHAIRYRRLTQLFLHLLPCGSAKARWTRCSSVSDPASATRWRRSSPGCAAHGSSAPMKPRCGSASRPTGTGCSRTFRW
jgi:transposase